MFAKQGESRNAFEFIESQVASYQTKLQQSESRLSEFKSENNLGTLANANNRISNYRAEIERLELDLVQIDTQIESVESQLAGENAIVRTVARMDVVVGTLGVMLAHAMMGEVTPKMAEAVSGCAATKLILPISQENVDLIGVSDDPLPHMVETLVLDHLKPLLRSHP